MSATIVTRIKIGVSIRAGVKARAKVEINVRIRVRSRMIMDNIRFMVKVSVKLGL